MQWCEMFPYALGGLKLKIFVKEQNDEPKIEKRKNVHKYMTVAPLSGEKAKEFYESVVNESSTPKIEKPKPPVPKVKKKMVRKSYKDEDLLWMAQNDDVKNLDIFFSQQQNYNINVVDDFGWTPLMCASCSGAEGAVKILLENNADVNKCDRLGNTALKLAKRNNWRRIVDLLENSHSTEIIEEEVVETIENFFCDLCKENFVMDKRKHESSTLHLFNSKIKTSTFYGIPENNRGFQLLLKRGWDKERGLGPYGVGRKFPIKAVVKKGRTGIGAPPIVNKDREYHTEKFENKRIKSYNNWKEKNFEKNFRLEFS